jgi:predicted nucleotidyltransferase
MNIHFDNKEVFEELKRLSIFNIKIGSWMYGTNDEFSDSDILYIYVPSYEEMNSMASNHHQFQYKEDGIDHIFVDIYNFIKNSLNGDSTINFEVINHPSLIGTDLEFLYNMRLAFSNHKIIRSYLGMARRDIKHISNGATDRDKNKKLNHVLRGYTFCELIIAKCFNTNIPKGSSLYNKIESNKLLTDGRERHGIGKGLLEDVSALREKVNSKLDAGTLGFPQYMGVVDMYLLDEHLSKWSKVWRDDLGNSDYYAKIKVIIYDAMENDIKYEKNGETKQYKVK